MATVREIAESYFAAWNARVTFRGPLGTAAGADAYVQGIRRLSEAVTNVLVRKMFIDGDDAATWFDLYTKTGPPCPTVNWSTVENGKIATVRVTFDPRPLLG